MSSCELTGPRASTLKLETLQVSSTELLVTAARADARATIAIERPTTPPGAPAASEGYLPDADLGPIYVYMLSDRRDQMISVGGISYRHPKEWQERMNAARTRTGEELDADLQVVIDTVLSLRDDPRGSQGYARELGDMLRTAKDLKGVRAP